MWWNNKCTRKVNLPNYIHTNCCLYTVFMDWVHGEWMSVSASCYHAALITNVTDALFHVCINLNHVISSYQKLIPMAITHCKHAINTRRKTFVKANINSSELQAYHQHKTQLTARMPPTQDTTHCKVATNTRHNSLQGCHQHKTQLTARMPLTQDTTHFKDATNTRHSSLQGCHQHKTQLTARMPPTQDNSLQGCHQHKTQLTARMPPTHDNSLQGCHQHKTQLTARMPPTQDNSLQGCHQHKTELTVRLPPTQDTTHCKDATNTRHN